MQSLKEIISKLRRGQRRQKGGTYSDALSKGRRIEPAALWSQDPAARTTVVLFTAISKGKKSKDAKYFPQPGPKRVWYVIRHRDRFNDLNRQVERQYGQLLEALQIGVFESDFPPELFEI